ncbi:MAG TPA: helix-turn-helix domain-containing protein [Candidatus Thermoplasmatota archaeon]|jgi:hypothetical protein|nr:helix-turn-helix domain-containing protein [Candidatus Thermoplasmatota archaeon]
MPAEELSFRVAHEGPLAEFSRAHPAASVSLWCDWKREALEIGGVSRAAMEPLRQQLAKQSWTEVYDVDDANWVFVFACLGLPHDTVLEAIDAQHCVAIPPTRFEQGWEVYHVISFSESKSRALFKQLREGEREVELLTKRKLSVNPLLNTRGAGVGAMFDGLTEKQLDALVQAFRHGLYMSPRRTTAASIADGLGVSRSTYEEHLRKAENRLVANLAPYLELHLKDQRAAKAAPAKEA